MYITRTYYTQARRLGLPPQGVCLRLIWQRLRHVPLSLVPPLLRTALQGNLMVALQVLFVFIVYFVLLLSGHALAALPAQAQTSMTSSGWIDAKLQT